MQFQQLAYFLAVVDTRHFTRAAQQAHVAQPSLSQQIRALERELGADLFRRARGNITLTDAGEALLPLARRIVADADSARTQVQEVAGLRRGRVRLGATPSLCTSLLPQVLHAYHREHPGISLHVQEGGSRDLVGELATGRLDLALLILPLQSHDPALATTELLTEELVLACALHAPPPTREPWIEVGALREQPLVMFRHGYDLREFTMASCRAEGFEPQFVVEGGEMDAVLAMVEAGLGAAVVPGMVADRRPLRTTPFAPPGLHRTIGLAHRKDVEPPRAARELRRVLLDHLQHAARTATLPPGTRPAPRR
ncbi:LysR family transcriptional regulator [Streptacidiphilus sp. P02-A3a]|uniref:LysR family transcriptional regulator n=1 Tax=Streptacidiphilus sp. P02-A3a TaxID=2704468 RepID=UPI0015FA175B|nr:LysR substrate-binding domain-containing protein [Streptacidiphilus sp. P02-A3a]QMU70060.1 LysR family transcriptional regulator [Streptacidiphilus sp. P02-A3a]